MKDPVLAYLETEKPAIIERLFELVSTPSVSTDPTYEDGMAQTRDLLQTRLRQMGLANVQTIVAGGHPAVYGEWLEAGKPAADKPEFIHPAKKKKAKTKQKTPAKKR